MSRPRRVDRFPWVALESVERGAEGLLRDARRSLGLGAQREKLASALSTLIGESVEIVVRSVDSRAPRGRMVELAFGASEGTGTCALALEPPLAGALLAALLRRPPPLLRLEAELDATLLGALSAVFIEAARSSGASLVLHPVPVANVARAANVHLSVIVGGKPYVAAFRVSPGLVGAASVPDRALLCALAGVELALPLVVSLSLATQALLAGLVVGAAYVPSDGFSIDHSGNGTGALVSGSSERGLAVELREFRKIVLGEPTQVALAATEAMVMESDPANEPTTFEAAVLDAPLVVRVELGQVSLPAREWAALKPGDVIETGRRIAEPVVLRAGGRVLATGELVEIEGELGVRVLEIPLPGSA